jgi:hypothetical protein
MFPMVIAHVDALRSLGNRKKCRFHHSLWLPDQGHHGTVGGLARIDIEYACTVHGTQGCGNFVNHLLATAFGEIRYTF